MGFFGTVSDQFRQQDTFLDKRMNRLQFLDLLGAGRQQTYQHALAGRSLFQINRQHVHSDNNAMVIIYLIALLSHRRCVPASHHLLCYFQKRTGNQLVGRSFYLENKRAVELAIQIRINGDFTYRANPER